MNILHVTGAFLLTRLNPRAIFGKTPKTDISQ
jgi:hypothetical protein